MVYISNRKIDFVYPKADGTIQIFDVNDWGYEYPFPWRYKLYNTFEENEKDFLSILYKDISLPYSLSDRMQQYLDNRKALYDEISKKYLPLIKIIRDSDLDFSPEKKKKLIKEIDDGINQLYPFIQN